MKALEYTSSTSEQKAEEMKQDCRRGWSSGEEPPWKGRCLENVGPKSPSGRQTNHGETNTSERGKEKDGQE